MVVIDTAICHGRHKQYLQTLHRRVIKNSIGELRHHGMCSP